MHPVRASLLETVEDADHSFSDAVGRPRSIWPPPYHLAVARPDLTSPRDEAKEIQVRRQDLRDKSVWDLWGSSSWVVRVQEAQGTWQFNQEEVGGVLFEWW